MRSYIDLKKISREFSRSSREISRPLKRFDFSPRFRQKFFVSFAEEIMRFFEDLNAENKQSLFID
jgi:hypothetical protein